MGRSEASRHALLLDALGTLVALEPPAPRLRAELAERFAIQVSEDQARQAIAAEIAYYRRHLDAGRDQASLAALRSRCAQALRAALPPEPAIRSLSISALTETLLASLQFSAFPDARPALAAWRSAGAAIVVVSNWDASLHEVLERLSLAPLVDAVVTSAEAGARKPSPEIFEHALRLVDVSPEHAIHVGDSLEEDVRGARASGIEPVLIARGGKAAAAGAVAAAGAAAVAGALAAAGAAAAAAAAAGARVIASLAELDPAGP